MSARADSFQAHWLLASAMLALTMACGGLERSWEPSSAGAGSGGKTGHGGAAGTGGAVPSGSAGRINSRGGAGGAARGSTAGSTGHGGVSTAGNAGAGFIAGKSSGGASNGGASKGGSSNGGAPAGGATSIELPDGCEPVTQYVGEASCSAEMTCPSQGEHVAVSCAPNASGSWSCACSNDMGSMTFDFPDATGKQTCEVSAKACLNPGYVRDDCKLMDQAVAQSCSVRENCSAQELTGVEFVDTTEWTASCAPFGSISACTCGGSLSPDRWITTTDFSAGCDFLSPLCRHMPWKSGDSSCESSFEDPGTGHGCHSEASCEQPVTLDDGSELTLAPRYELRCRPTDDGTRCACEDAAGNEVLTLLLDIPADDIETCRVTRDACAEVAPIDFTDTGVCTPSKDMPTPTGWTIEYQCWKTGTTAGTSVKVLTTAGVTCAEREDGNWLCTCEAPPGMVTAFAVSADSAASADPFDSAKGAALVALDQCPDFAPGLAQ